MHYHRRCHGQVLSNDETARPGEIKMIERVLFSNRKTYESINLTGKGKYLVKFRMVLQWWWVDHL